MSVNMIVYLPNEVFKDFSSHFTNASKFGFAYSYYTYINFLYKYCLHFDDNNEFVSQRRIKEFLGYNPDNKTVNSIIKDNGVLDSIGYTKSTSEYPVRAIFDEEGNLFDFETASDIRKNIPNKNIISYRGIKVKSPLLAHTRYEEGVLDGTFYQVEYTHSVDFEVFKSIVQDEDLGCVGFLIYGFIKYQNGIRKGYMQSTYDYMTGVLKMSRRTIRKYTALLETKGYLAVKRETIADSNRHCPNIYLVIK
ncbi:hypothetical protein [Bacillus cereus]|nr:hypothetical protein [Bacillus cereus]